MQIRLLIATLMLLLAMAGKAQIFQTNNTPYKFRGVKADSLLIAAKGCDTAYLSNPKWGTSTSGALYVDTCNNRFYFHNGLKWNQVTGGGGGGGGVDSFYYNLRSLNDTTAVYDRGDRVDTLVIRGGIGQFVDSVTTVGDSLYYWKGGTSFFSANLALAAAGGDTTIFIPILDSTGNDNYRMLYAKDNKITASSYMKWSEVFNRLTISPTSIITSNYDSIRLVVDGAIYTGRLVSISGRFENNGGSGMTASNDSLKFTPTPPAADTTTYKPAALSNTGGLARMSSWPITPSITSYGKNSGGDSTILLLSNGQRFAAKDSTGGGAGSGVTTVGTFSGSSQTNGASISGSTITFGPADATKPGMVSTGAQTWAGEKTFSNTVIPNLINFNNGATGDRIFLNATGERIGLGLSSLGAVLFGNTSQGVSIFAGNYVSVPNSGTPLIRVLPATTTISNDLNITGSLNFFNSSTNAYGIRQYYNASGQRWGFGGSNTSGSGNMTSLQWFNPSAAFWTFNGGGTLNLEGSNEWLRIASGGIGINTGSTNNASAQLQINSTTKGFLPPRITTTQQNAISTPADGLQIYNSTLSQPHYRDGSTWQAQVGMTFGTAAPTSTPTAVGNFFLDTTNKKLYVATGTTSSADWNILN